MCARKEGKGSACESVEDAVLIVEEKVEYQL